MGKNYLCLIGLFLMAISATFARELKLKTDSDLRNNVPVELKTADNDPLNGPKKEYYPNGKVMKEYILKDGKINGSYKFYNKLGQLVSDQYFLDGEPNGYLRSYYENGQLKSEVNMKNGELTGSSKEYFSDGTLKSESSLAGEPFKQSGKTNLYFEDGKLWKEITVSLGKLVQAIAYDRQGRVVSEESEGKSISYWYEEDGKKHVVINGVEQK